MEIHTDSITQILDTIQMRQEEEERYLTNLTSMQNQ